ncbi:unnamed protein product [Paramecium sonneborni]|uniref:Uncharacterized protein n=1 Tax=Paramecium sonneborni TaxID=65129 RepID=A0A8S1R1E2_9CILI|nr:unnamed protein product [Paramecium sonneborni]
MEEPSQYVNQYCKGLMYLMQIFSKPFHRYQEILDYLVQEMILERKFYRSKDYLVCEFFVFHLIKIQSQVPEKELLLLCQEQITQMGMIEKDENARAFLKNKEIIERQQKCKNYCFLMILFSSNTKEEMNQKTDEIEQAISFEGSLLNKDIYFVYNPLKTQEINIVTGQIQKNYQN